MIISKYLNKDREFREEVSTGGKAFQASGVSRKTRIAAFVMALVMLSPLSAFASSSTSATTSETQSSTKATMTTDTQATPVSESEFDMLSWDRSKSIEIAVANGKAVELNKVFEYQDHKIKLEYAVWEEDSLIIKYSSLDKDKENTITPSQISLLNEEGVNVSQGWGTGSSYDGGIIDFDLKDKFENGDKLYLNIYTIRYDRPDIDKADYMYRMWLDKSLATDGSKSNLNVKLNTDYGTVILNTASNDEGRLAIDYSFEVLPLVKELTSNKPESNIHVHLFPEISLKDKNDKIVRVNGSSYEDNGETGKIYFDGMPELGQNLTILVQCSEKLVNWKLELPVKRIPAETVSINKEFKSEDGIFKLKDLRLEAASTYLDFEFIPEKDSKVTRVEPEVLLNFGDKRILGTANSDEFKGKIVFNYPLSKQDLDNASLYLYSVNRNVQYDESIEVDFDKATTYNLKIDGSELVISNMVIKDGKTCFDIGTDDVNRKFTDYRVGIKTEKKHMSWSSTSSYSVYSGMFEGLYGKEEGSKDSPENKGMKPLKMSVQVDGEHKNLEITVRSLIYTDIYNCEIKLK